MAEGKYFGLPQVMHRKKPRRQSPSLFHSLPITNKIIICTHTSIPSKELNIVIQFSFDLLIVIIPSSGHRDGIVLNHLKRTTTIVQVFFSKLNFSVIHIPTTTANEQSGNSNGRTGNYGHSTGRGDIVILALAGGVGHPGSNVGLAIANEVGTISIRIHEQLGHELFPGEEPILIAPRGQSVRRSQGVSAVLRAVAVPTAGPRAQIDLLGCAVLVERVLVGNVVDLGISCVETDAEHGVGRGGRYAAQGDG